MGRIDRLTNNEVTQAVPCHYVLISDMEVDGLQTMPPRNNAEISQCAPIKEPIESVGGGPLPEMENLERCGILFA